MSDSTPPLAVIFDMDGVLANTVQLNLESAVEAYEELGITLPLGLDELVAFRGLSLPDLHTHWMRELGHSIPYEDYRVRYSRRQVAKQTDLLRQGADPALTTFVRALAAAGIPLGIGSMNVARNCDLILKGLGLHEYFSVIVTSEDTNAHKPEPDVFLIAAKRLGVTPEHCVVIEDAENGIEAAHRAGMVAIGFTGFLTNSNEPLLPHADLRVNSWRELTVDRVRALVDRDSLAN